MAAPWESSNLTHSHKRDAHRCAHQYRRRFLDHAEWRAHSTVALTTASSHQCNCGHFGAVIRHLTQICVRQWAYIHVSLGTSCPRAGLGCRVVTNQKKTVDFRTSQSKRLIIWSFHIREFEWQMVATFEVSTTGTGFFLDQFTSTQIVIRFLNLSSKRQTGDIAAARQG